MTELLDQVSQDMKAIVNEWIATGHLKEGDTFVIGCSTSEVAGEHIGTSGSEEVAARIFEELTRLQKKCGIELAFQCCEHLNRAIVMERALQKKHNLSPVSAVPHRKAGGSMATYAFYHFDEAVLVEDVQAGAGMDIGNTLIGMHLKRVAVPLRFEQKKIGNAPLTGARTRPKLIGGERARYE